MLPIKQWGPMTWIMLACVLVNAWGAFVGGSIISILFLAITGYFFYMDVRR